MTQNPTILSYCGQEARKHDNDRYLACLFAPAERRESLFALLAFNQEIARTRELVTEPMLGQIRLQWWRENIDAVFDRSSRAAAARHAVLDPLAEAVDRHGLSRAHFDRLIDAREADLADEPPASLSCLVNYAEVTAVPLVMLALEALGAGDEPAVAAGRHVGIAWALTGLLRAVPFHARQKRLYLPAALMAEHGAATGRLFEMKPGPELRPVVQAVASEAHRHLTAARALRRRLPKAALPALLPAVLAETYLGAIAKADHDVFAPPVQMPHPLRHLRLGWAALRGRY